MSFYLVIISPLDAPLLELSLQSAKAPGSATPASAASSSSSAFPSWSSFTSATGSDLGSAPSAAGAPGSSSRPQIMQFGGQLPPPPPSAGSGVVGPNGAGQGPVPPTPGAAGSGPGWPGERAMLQMIAHMSLDGVEEVMEGSGSLYLRNVEKHNEWTVSAFLASSVKFVLLHDHKNDDGIRSFFMELWELYVKVLLNPFHTVNTPIRNPGFEAKVRASARKFL